MAVASSRRRRLQTRTTGNRDAAILSAFERMELDLETAVLLDVIPLVQVAWADGQISRSERLLIVELALRRRLLDTAPLYHRLSGWLDQRPSHDFFERVLDAVRARLEGLHPRAREAVWRRVLTECAAVACASGSQPDSSRGVSEVGRQALMRVALALSVPQRPP
jgi:hypothetical protein